MVDAEAIVIGGGIVGRNRLRATRHPRRTPETHCRGDARRAGAGRRPQPREPLSLRPVSEDGLPVLGPVPGVAGAYLATGHGPTGLTLGPYSGKLVADLVRGETPATDIDAFRVDRFREFTNTTT